MLAAIDIGTSYSSICVIGRDEKIHPVKVSTDISIFGGDYTLPTAVFAEDDGTMLVGQAAMNKSRKKPENFSREFKRIFGQDKPIILGGREYSVEKLYTELLLHMKSCAERSFGERIDKVFLTHPASYGNKKKERLMNAARGAGFFSVGLIDEPTAAALNCCREGEVQKGKAVLIYDFGGGTFDASLLRSCGESFELLTEPMGLEDCGGSDIDRFIYRDMRKHVSSVLGDVQETASQKNYWRRLDIQLNELSVKAKHHLSISRIFEEDIAVGLEEIPYCLRREELNEAIAYKVGRTTELCGSLLKRAGVTREELAAIWMVGGTSHVPFVQEMVRRFAGNVEVRQARDMELAVAMGALQMGQIEDFDKAEDRKADKTVGNSINKAISSLGTVYFYRFFKENISEKFSDVVFWQGSNQAKNVYIREMFAATARTLVTDLKVKPDLSCAPYLEWCYGSFPEEKIENGWSKAVGAWSIGIYYNGIFTRNITKKNGKTGYVDRYIPWKEFLDLGMSFVDSTCFLGQYALVKTENYKLSYQMYNCMKGLQKKLGAELGKKEDHSGKLL